MMLAVADWVPVAIIITGGFTILAASIWGADR